MGAVMVYLFMPTALMPAFLKRLEYLVYDQRMQLSVATDTLDSQIVVVDIDQRSQQKKGRWPWPRNVTAELIAVLLEHYQVAGIGLDVYFPNEANCSVEADDVLMSVLQRYSPFIVMALKLKDRDPEDLVQRADGTGKGVALSGIDNLLADHSYVGRAIDYSGNLERFIAHQPAIGHILPVTDGDAKVRRLKPLYQFENQYFDTLSLAMWRQILAADSLRLDVSLDHWLDSPKFRLMLGGQDTPYYVPVNQQGEVLIPYHSQVESVSAVDVLDKFLDAGSLKGKFILIGSSAKAQGDDLVATPLNPELPGVEIHAVMLGAMLAQMEGQSQRFKVQPTHEKALQVVLMFLAVIMLLGARQLGVRAMLMVGPLLLLSWVAFNYWMWLSLNVALDFLPLSALILMLLLYFGISDLIEINARHQHVRKMFGYYLPAPVVQRLATDRTGIDWLKPERKEMTIMFADVQGFTVMAEALLPEEVADITWRLFTSLTDVIHKHQGTVDKYMGDAVMAFWGAPLPDSQHVLHATEAAREIQQVVEYMNETVFKDKSISIRMGIGINTGVVVVGNLGSEQRHAYTVMGAAVNAASAIQQLTRYYEHNILIGEEAASYLPESMRVEVGDVVTKKLSHKIKIFALKG
jgi:adenylate cyclase